MKNTKLIALARVATPYCRDPTQAGRPKIQQPTGKKCQINQASALQRSHNASAGTIKK